MERDTWSHAPDLARTARLHRALLYKSIGRLDEARGICENEIAAGNPGKAAELVPFRVALAGLCIVEGRIADAGKEVDAVQWQLRGLPDDNSAQFREVRHVAAMLLCLRYEEARAHALESQRKSVAGPDMAEADRLADRAADGWRRLLTLQEQCGDAMGEARTHVYLSKLSLLRGQACAMRSAAAGVQQYQEDLAEFQAGRKRYKDGVRQYRRDCAEAKALESLKREYAELEEAQKALQKRKADLLKRRADVLARYDAAWSDMLARDQDNVPMRLQLEDALRSAESACAILKDLPECPSLHFIALCQQAAVLRACAPWKHIPDKAIEECLSTAVATLESPRSGLAEADDSRAEFFSHYLQAFEQLIEWYRLHDQPRDALVCAEMCRSRTLLDWLHADGGSAAALTRDKARLIVDARIRGTDPIIYYHVGAENAYLFVLGVGPGPRLHRLGVDGHYVDRGQDPEASAKECVARQNVTARMVNKWVEEYVGICKLAGEFPGAGREKLEALGSYARALLPGDLSKDLAAAMNGSARPLIASANGPLQRLPLEILWDQGEGKFLSDLLPPSGIAYSPSLAILDEQERSGAVAQHGEPCLVTVACSHFPRTAEPRLADLRFAIGESNKVADAFGGRQTCQLLDDQATLKGFVDAMERKPLFLLLATHSFVLEHEPVVVLHDGRLSVREIRQLDLSGCRLAVLNACRTNAGREVPGEMAMSISKAFLAARAQRVVASQWPIDDEAACLFATALFRQVATDWKAGRACDYARAVAAARREVRSRRGDDPSYWAPFILIGPARDLAP